jgi:hypothetical protein
MVVEELIVKAQARKESSLEIHGLPGTEETTERPQLRQHTNGFALPDISLIR